MHEAQVDAPEAHEGGAVPLLALGLLACARLADAHGLQVAGEAHCFDAAPEVVVLPDPAPGVVPEEAIVERVEAPESPLPPSVAPVEAVDACRFLFE